MGRISPQNLHFLPLLVISWQRGLIGARSGLEQEGENHSIIVACHILFPAVLTCSLSLMLLGIMPAKRADIGLRGSIGYQALYRDIFTYLSRVIWYVAHS